MRTLLILLLLLTLSSQAWAQDCFIGVYGDAEGTQPSLFMAEFLTPYSFYVVMHLEGIVNAVAYQLEIPDLYDPQDNPSGELFLVNSFYGPQESGINVVTPGGSNIGLGECAVGFGGLPVAVARYEIMVSPLFWPSGPVQLHPNVDADPTAVAYSDCNGNVLPCPGTGSLWIYPPDLAAESESWSAVKSLYRR